MDIDWIGGHVPTAFFRDHKDRVVERREIGDRDYDEMMAFFSENGLTVKPNPDYMIPDDAPDREL